MISMIIALTGATLAAHSPPANAPEWVYAVYVLPALVPVEWRHRGFATFVSVLCAVAAIIGPLSLILPGPWHGCSDLEYFGILVAASGLSLHVKTIHTNPAPNRGT